MDAKKGKEGTGGRIGVLRHDMGPHEFRDPKLHHVEGSRLGRHLQSRMGTANSIKYLLNLRISKAPSGLFGFGGLEG